MAKKESSRTQKNGINVNDIFLMDFTTTYDEIALIVKAGDPSLEKQFALTGKKIGKSITITLPSIFEATDGAEIKDEDLQQLNERDVTFTIYQSKVPFTFTQEDLLLSLDEFNERVVAPAARGMVRLVEEKAFASFVKTGNFVGNYDVKMSQELLLEAGKILTEQGAPSGRNQRMLFLSPNCTKDLIVSTSGHFNPARDVSDMFVTGQVKNEVAGFSCVESIFTEVHTFGSAVGVDDIKVSADSTGSTIKISGLENNLNVGDRFMIEGVKRLKANLQPSSDEQGFSIVAVSADKTEITVSPAIRVKETDGTNANVSRKPTAGDKLYFVGKAGETAEVNVSFISKALKFANIEQSKIQENGMKVLTKDVYSFRFSKQYNITKDTMIYRVDCFYGVDVVYEDKTAVILTQNMSSTDSPITRAKKELVAGKKSATK